MKIERRNFIKGLAAVGFGAGFSLRSPKIRAGDVPDHFLVTISADGGWDTTALFDPKGQAKKVNRVDLDPSLKTSNGIQWSAVPDSLKGDDYSRVQEQYRRFFTTYSDQLTVIKGMDTLTSSHIFGSLASLSGKFEHYPTLGALYSAIKSPTLPLSYVTFGGRWQGNNLIYDLDVNTAPLLGGTFITSRANPNFAFRGGDDYYEQVKKMHLNRLRTLKENEIKTKNLEQRAKRIDEMIEQRVNGNIFAQLTETLSSFHNIKNQAEWFPGRRSALKDQAPVAAAALASGLTASASLNMGDFDTHGLNDPNQFPLLGDLLEGIHFLIEALEHYGIANKTTILVVSDIGRLPFYNATGGKDHSAVGGQMVIHPKSSRLGGKVFGETTSKFELQPIDLFSGKAHQGGTQLNVKHCLKAMRQVLDIEGSNLARQYHFNEEITPGIFV